MTTSPSPQEISQAATPEMVAAAVFNCRFRCCMCNVQHQYLQKNNQAKRCFNNLINVSDMRWGEDALQQTPKWDPLTEALYSEPLPFFDTWQYIYVLAAPSVEAAKTFLRERNKEWLLHWYKVEREILDPERELPPFQLGKNLLRFEGGYRPFRLSCDSLKTMMKEECLAAIVHSMLSYTDNVLLDVQWKKIKDPAAFLLATPDNTPVLVTPQYGVKLLPKAIRKVAEALDYLRKLGKV